MENLVGSVDCSNLYTAMKNLSNTCKSVAYISTNNFAKSLTKALRTLPKSVEPSKSVVNHLPCYKVICSM